MRLNVPDTEIPGIEASARYLAGDEPTKTTSGQLKGAALATLKAIASAKADIAAPDREALVATARQLYCDNSDYNVEIDEDTVFSRGEDGTWVQAWVYVPNQEEVDHTEDGTA
jgi:hypothetical protein